MGNHLDGGTREGAPAPSSVPLPLHSELHGESGPSIVLFHGFGANGHTWNRWVPELTVDHRVLVVEMKGVGASPKPRGENYGPEEQALLLHRLILQRDLGEVTLVGHSLGGGIALLTAFKLLSENPSRLKRLVLVAAATYPQPVPKFIRFAARPRLGPLALWLLPAGFIMRKALQMAYHDPGLITASQVEAYAEPIRTPQARYALARMALQITPNDMDAVVARYPEIHLPTLLIWGREDRIVPLRYGERLERDIPNARLEILEKCGHIPQEEKPRESLELFRSFLAEDRAETPS